MEGTCLSPEVLDVVDKSVSGTYEHGQGLRSRTKRSVYNAVMDVFCAVMPYFIIRDLNIPRRDKRNLMILMGGSIL